MGDGAQHFAKLRSTLIGVVPSFPGCMRCNIDGHEGIVTTTVKMNVQPRPQKIPQAISALEDGEPLNHGVDS